MSDVQQSRVPAGVRGGGQFSQSARGEAGVTLHPRPAPWGGRRDGEVADLPLSALVTTHTAMTETLDSGRESDSPDEPVLVRARMDDPSRWEIADGHHRVARAIRRGASSVRVEFDTTFDDEPYEGQLYDFAQHCTPERARVIAGWGQARPDWINERDEVDDALWDALRAGTKATGDEVPLPPHFPLLTDPDLVVTAAYLDLGEDLRPALRLALPREYRTRARATSDGVTWEGEYDRLSPDDMAAIEAWTTPHLERVDAAADVIRRHGWLDPLEFHLLTGHPHIYEA